MTKANKETPYTGEEAPESQELIDKVRHLSLGAQSVLYAMLIEEGEQEPAKREGFTSVEIHEACASCSLDGEATPQTLIEAGISELKGRGSSKSETEDCSSLRAPSICVPLKRRSRAACTSFAGDCRIYLACGDNTPTFGGTMVDYLRRKKQIQELMRAKGVDAMLIAGAENYYYITGDYRRQARMLFYQDADPTIIVFQPEVEQVRARTWVNDVRGWSSVNELMQHFFNAMRESDLRKATVGFDTHTAPGFEVFRFRKLNPEITMVENDEIMSELRMVKSADEIARMKKTAHVAELGMMAAADALVAGATENDVAREAEYAMRKAGSERLGFLTFVNSGERSLGLHGFVSQRVIESGDPVIVDLHPVADLYACDMARTFVCSEAASGIAAKTVSTEFIKLAAAYDEAQQGVIDEVTPGWKVKEVTQFMVESINKTNFGKYVVPGYIHGVGLEAEEYPHPSHYPQHGEIVLKPNMTVSVGHAVLAAPGIGGYRREDVVRITENGCEVLTR